MHILSDAQIIASFVSIVIATVANGVTVWARIRRERAAIAALGGGLSKATAEISNIKKAVATIEKEIAAHAQASTRSTPYGRRATDKPPDTLRPPPALGPDFDPKAA